MAFPSATRTVSPPRRTARATCVAQGRCLSREDTDAVLLEWMFALAFSWLIAEPILVLLFALVPIMNPPRKQLAFCAVVVEWLHLIGLDPSVFF